MKRRRMDAGTGYGQLPSSAPLANPYVPFQAEGAQKYEPGKALIRGTLFPGLDLPFQGMVNQKEKPMTPMTQLQMLAFAVQELALYLDTHREDREALALYRSYQERMEKAKADYEKRYGPLTHCSAQEGQGYRWLDDPWPWEYGKKL